MVYLSGGEDNHWSPTPPQSPSPSPSHCGSEPLEGDSSDQDPSYNPENDRSGKRRQRGTQCRGGSPVNIEKLCDQERNEIIKALSSLHDHGVLHGDMRYQFGKINVRLIDLGFARKFSNKKEAKIEMNILKQILGRRN